MRAPILPRSNSPLCVQALCALAVCWGASGAALEWKSVDGVVGWRVDRASLGVCAALSDGDSYGFGLAKFRSVNVAQFGARTEAQLTTHWRGNASLMYGYIANGHVVDSGLCDLNSNPFNARSYSYTTCCTPAACVVDPTCECDCRELTPRSLALTTARLRGSAWDWLLGATYEFRPCTDWKLGLGIHWEYDWQRYRFDQAIWGPMAGSIVGVDCLGRLSSNFIVNEPEGEDHFALLTPLQVSHLIGETSTDPSMRGGGCLALGYCFNGTTYRASWNMAMASLELDWKMTAYWEWEATYRLGFGGYSGKFETLGGIGGEGCHCDLCPQFQQLCGTDLADLSIETKSFAPSTMRTQAAAFGQDVRLLTRWLLEQWRFGIDLSYFSRRTMNCTEIDPCQSCTTICNGALAVGSSSSRPIWSGATLNRASWNSLQLNLHAGYCF